MLKETLSGQGATHCTNGIVIQQRVDSCQPDPTLTEHQASQKKKKKFYFSSYQASPI